MRYFIELAYNGKAYHGWQNQPNAITVQEVLEKALSTLLNKDISLVGAGRTDAGVHAKQMFAHFNYEDAINDAELVFKLNSYLPNDIAIYNIFKVKPNAHARFDASSRSYLYRIAIKKNAFNFDEAYHFKPKLNIVKLNEASKILLDYKNFQCFSKTNSDVKTYNCIITKAEWQIVNDELHFTISADRFLRNMVRAIVGTMLNIGTGKILVNELHNIIKSKSRSEAGFSVPAHGLYLTKVSYPNEIMLND